MYIIDAAITDRCWVRTADTTKLANLSNSRNTTRADATKLDRISLPIVATSDDVNQASNAADGQLNVYHSILIAKPCYLLTGQTDSYII